MELPLYQNPGMNKRTKKQRPFVVTEWKPTPEDPVLFSEEQKAQLEAQGLADKWLYAMGGCFVCGADVAMVALCGECVESIHTGKLCDRHEWCQLKCNKCCERSPNQ